jgi:hypothetical protein
MRTEKQLNNFRALFKEPTLRLLALLRSGPKTFGEIESALAPHITATSYASTSRSSAAMVWSSACLQQSNPFASSLP